MKTNLYKIALGTTSKQKIGYVEDVLALLEVEATLIANDVESGVSEQPMTSAETKQGALHRAIKALEQAPNVNFSLGIEVGYQLTENEEYEILCWAAATDSREKVITACSHSFLLPQFHQRILKQELPLGEYVDQYVKESHNSLEEYLAQMLKTRKPFIMNAVRDVLLYYLLDSEYNH